MALVNVIIIPHAMFQIQARNIDPEFVREVALNPQQNVPASGGRQVRQSRYFDNMEGTPMLLRVVVETNAQEISVVTAYKTSRLEKYWVE